MAFEPKEPQIEIKYDKLRIYSDEELNNYTDEELKNFKIKHEIPMCEDLEKGPWRVRPAIANNHDQRLNLGQEPYWV